MKLGELLVISGRMEFRPSLEPNLPRPAIIPPPGISGSWSTRVLEDTRPPECRYLNGEDTRQPSLRSVATTLIASAQNGKPTSAALAVRPAGNDHTHTHADRFTRLCLWFLVALLALAAIACGFGAQQIEHNRQKHQLAQRIRQAERELKNAELTCRQMQASFALHVAREQQQEPMEVRPASFTPAKGNRTKTL